MKLLIKKARIVDPGNTHNGQTLDLLIQDGRIVQLAPSINQSADQVLELENLHVSAGWVDVFSHFGEPGYEQKETIASGMQAALAGGYTDVLLIPNTKPVTQDKAGVEYLIQRCQNGPVNVHPIGAITKGSDGKELAELYDMHHSGAKAFSDGTRSVQSAGLLLKALQYVKAIQATIIQLPDDHSIQPHGLMHEGIPSTQMGLPGRPDISESIQVNRDIALNQYTESNLHLTGISSQSSLNWIRQGKQSQPGLSCSTTPYHLLYSDADLAGYNTLLKVNPPIRTEADREALKLAVIDGTIDCIATHHLPHEQDRKVCEFEQAASGMIGLETAFGAIRTALPDLAIEQIVQLLSNNPRRIFGLPTIKIEEGQPATLTLFNPTVEWTVDESAIRSLSHNTPLLGKTLTGRAYGITQEGQYFSA
jgi:dihydroorotase